jgi:hypothetical protein
MVYLLSYSAQTKINEENKKEKGPVSRPFFNF